MKFYKYQGAGNDFLIADNRDGTICLSVSQIVSLCDRRYGLGADGLMLLELSDKYDFRMNFYNSDGSTGMMCGNGGRCIVAFAADMGINHYDFEAADGFHTAEILENSGDSKLVRLKMKDVDSIEYYSSLNIGSQPSCGCFLDTGTCHYVQMVSSVEDLDLISRGREIRYAQEFIPLGVNVNFVQPFDGGLMVRTYEKGVEDETFACGTGIVASCIAAFSAGIKPSSVDESGRLRYDVHAKRDALAVDFIPADIAKDVWLTGPATFVAEINCNIL